MSNYGHIYYVAPEQKDKLKAATERSDIYSLGKLLHFIITGRDPDGPHLCDFTIVIDKATQYDSDDRYENIIEVECAYEEVKSLILTEEVTGRVKTLIELLSSAATINWQEFHRLAIAGTYRDHVFSDYVLPVVKLLSRDDNLSK